MDTGAEISVLPKSILNSKQKNIGRVNLPTVFAANGSKIQIYGKVPLRLDLGFPKQFY